LPCFKSGVQLHSAHVTT